MSETIDRRGARRLALQRAGLLKPKTIGLPERARAAMPSARRAAEALVRHFGYLQLDTVSIAGARSHALVLLARLNGLEAGLVETLLRPGAPLFEYWGHEASWLPLELYPAFEFRRRRFREHPWWGDVIAAYPKETRRLLARIAAEGPLRSSDFEGGGSKGWWRLKPLRKVAAALWSSGELAIAERHKFQRRFDLAERVIPEALRAAPLALEDAIAVLVRKALEGHGWADEKTLAATWRLRRLRPEIRAALHDLRDAGQARPCVLKDRGLSPRKGWILTADLERVAGLRRARPRRDQGRLLSPFDPILWDRGRVRELFGFEQVLEIYVPKAKRRFGYFCLPVLAGDALVARVDLKAERKAGRLTVLAYHREPGSPAAEVDAASAAAVRRLAQAVGLKPGPLPAD